MKEKILININNKKGMKKVLIFFIVLIVISIISIMFFIWSDSYQRKASLAFDICDSENRELKKRFSNYKTSDCWKEVNEDFPSWGKSETPRTLGLVGMIAFIPCTIIIALFYFAGRNMQLTITDKRVCGKSTFGRRVDLPVDSISSISKNLLLGITVSTSSGKINWFMISNKEKVYGVLEKLIISRQKKDNKRKINNSAADELKKYKELLDDGAITKEEYNKKKKELLNQK